MKAAERQEGNVIKEQEAKTEEVRPSSQTRNWQDLAHQYRAIGIASVAAAVQMFGARNQEPATQKAAVRYIGNRSR